MKLVFNTDQIYLHGGIEKVMATKANYFCNIPNLEVYIITTEQRSNNPCYNLDERIHLIDLGINYDRTKSYFSLTNLKKAFLHFQRQKALFSKLKPDFVISPNYNFDHYWLPFIKKRFKLIKERHSSHFFEDIKRQKAKGFSFLLYKINDWIDSKYNHIVVLNDTEKKYVNSKNAVVIPNPIQENSYSANLEKNMVIAAGRISPVKGFEHLINVWKYIHKHFEDWQLHIYGQSYLNCQEILQKQVINNGLEKVIFFKGSVEDIPSAMTDYSIYAMTSLTECFPMVLLEALSVGLPIVSFDSPNGPRHIIRDNDDGFLTAYLDIEMFAEKLILLMSNKELRKIMGNNAKINSKRFVTEVVMEEWRSLLNI